MVRTKSIPVFQQVVNRSDCIKTREIEPSQKLTNMLRTRPRFQGVGASNSCVDVASDPDTATTDPRQPGGILSAVPMGPAIAIPISGSSVPAHIKS